MPDISSGPAAGTCGPAAGRLTTTHGVVPFDPLTERARTIWTSGEFGRIAAGYATGAAAFVHRLSLSPGETVLDLACGTGNLSIPAARAGAHVIGLDIAPNLIDEAGRQSAAAGFDIRFDVGAAEALPYRDGTFDTVISMFGVMFAGRPEQALSEIVRVTRRGGRIALANWVPDGFIGSMLRAHAARVPPPPGVPGPLAWGDEAVMRRRLDAHTTAIRAVQFVPRTIALAFPLPPEAVVALFREYYGPSVQTFGALDAPGRAGLEAELVELWRGRNRADEGATAVEAEYLEVRIDMA
jgi:SAM-dependent methyltransferase